MGDRQTVDATRARAIGRWSALLAGGILVAAAALLAWDLRKPLHWDDDWDEIW